MKAFKAVRHVMKFTFPVAALPEKVFPLLCPVSEREWLKGWACDVLFSVTGRNEKGCVFTTRGPKEKAIVWVTSRYDEKERRVEFVNVMPGVMTGNVKISLGSFADGVTPVTYENICTSLSRDGNKLLSSGSFEDRYWKKVAWIERSINHFLATGTRLEA